MAPRKKNPISLTLFALAALSSYRNHDILAEAFTHQSSISPLSISTRHATVPVSNKTSLNVPPRAKRSLCLSEADDVVAITENSAPSSPVASTLLIIALDTCLRGLFLRLSIPFPSSLAGCGILFSTLLAVNAINEDWGESMYGVFSPGAEVLAKWLPVFFVPSLVTLPLAPSIGSAAEVAKVGVIIIGGFFFSLLTTCWSVMGVRKLLKPGHNDASPVADISTVQEEPTDSNPPPRPFSNGTSKTLGGLTVASLIMATLTATLPSLSQMSPFFRTGFLFYSTLFTFVFGARLNPKFTKIVHPLVTCTTLTWTLITIFSFLTKTTFLATIQAYKVGSLLPIPGAGDILLALLNPAVLALSCQMYSRRKLMKLNIPELLAAITTSSLGGLFATAFFVRFLNMSSNLLRLSLLSRNITSPLAISITSFLQGDPSLAVTFVVLSGLFGANFGASILTRLGVKDPVARGLGIGAASHGLGTAAFKDEKDAFPFAAMGMALTGAVGTTLVSMGFVRNLLVKIALG